MNAIQTIKEIATTDLFARNPDRSWATGALVGRPFYFDYRTTRILVADRNKHDAGGIPQGCFLLAYYDNEPDANDSEEAVLLRVLGPTALPTDSDVVASMVQYYKEGIATSGKQSELDVVTKYSFSFSGLECSVLGSFYRTTLGRVRFGADLENFYSAHNYTVIKPTTRVLTKIVNYREYGDPGTDRDRRIGHVRYSSSRRFQERETEAAPVFVQAEDFAGKRTALFGMTRTGKSNTVKKYIQACVEMGERAPRALGAGRPESSEEILKQFTDDGHPKYPIGQLIFDVNGEYANLNLQDRGTAIFEIYSKLTDRYCTVPKSGFKVLKVNFYNEIENGLELIKSHPRLNERDVDYLVNFLTVDLSAAQPGDNSALTRQDRKRALYKCILYRANFAVPNGTKVRFEANADVRQALATKGVNVDPKDGLDLDQACAWWEALWEIYDEDPTNCFSAYRTAHNGREWADDDLKALLVMLTRRRKSGGQPGITGFNLLRDIAAQQHTATVQTSFQQDILEQLRKGRIVIVDLSLGDPEAQALFTRKICEHVFSDSMQRFTSAQPNNFIQFYFEEAHNLFPKRNDQDLRNIYNRLAKEGAKLNLGIVYATQEVSSISANILKNTQNWFIAHLNNDDEIKELRKYYDFGDFTDGLIRFSQDTDRGFVRMKTYSSPFVIPVQIDRFPPETKQQ